MSLVARRLGDGTNPNKNVAKNWNDTFDWNHIPVWGGVDIFFAVNFADRNNILLVDVIDKLLAVIQWEISWLSRKIALFSYELPSLCK